MNSATRTESRTGHAARVARKVLGDMQSLVRSYSCSNEDDVQKYAHDIEIGIDNSCISEFWFYLCAQDGTVLEAYAYVVKENGEIEQGSGSSGRFEYREKLVGSEMTVTIFLRDRPRWEALKAAGKMRISWAPGSQKDVSGMQSQTDGAYKSGNLGVQRTAYRRI